MTRFLLATVLLAVCVSYASSAEWTQWRKKEPEKRCYCNGYGGYGNEVWMRSCYGSDCTKPYEEQQRECYNCEDEPVLSAGEIAGIVVGAVVFLILIIIIIIWCCYCGCDCDDGGRGPRRWHSDESIYRGKVVHAQPPTVVAGPHLHAPVVQQFQPAPVTYAVPPKPVSFVQSVQQPQMMQQQQFGAVYAQQTPRITVLA